MSTIFGLVISWLALLPATTANTSAEYDIKVPKMSAKSIIISFPGNCSLETAPNVMKHIATVIENHRLVKLETEILNVPKNFQANVLGDIYRPNEWVLSVTDAGKSLLLLKEYFDSMSLKTLAYGVTRVSLTFSQQPDGCLSSAHVTAATFERIMRRQMLNNFGAEEYDLPSGINICNRHIDVEGSDAGKIKYVCCGKTLKNDVMCNDLTANMWITLVFNIIFLLQILFVIVSPLLLPKSLLTMKGKFLDYVYESADNDEMSFRVQKIDFNLRPEPGLNVQQAKLSERTHLNLFREFIKTLRRGEERDVAVKTMKLSVKASKIIPEGDAPVGIISFIEKFFGRCEIRKEISSVEGCCNGKIFPCSSRITMPWYQCLTYISKTLMLLLVASPWLLRVWFYYIYERPDKDNQRSALTSKQLTVPYSGSLTTELTPIHAIFMLAYIIVPVNFMLFHISPLILQEKLKFTIRTCFMAMHKTSRLEACGVFTSCLLWPLKKTGLIGCLLMPVWIILLPFMLIMLGIQVLPIVNLSMRIIINFVYYVTEWIHPTMKCSTTNTASLSQNRAVWYIKQWVQSVIVVDFKESNRRRNKFIHLFALAMVFVTMWALLLIVIECLSFYVECAVYIITGLILNPDSTMKFVSLILLVGFYGINCFRGVHAQYSTFSKILSSEIQKQIGDRVMSAAMQSENVQQNSAFCVKSGQSQGSKRLQLSIGSMGFLKWKAPRLLLFLDNTDTPHITKRFLFKMAKQPHFACPNQVYLLYLKALVDFCLILLFLSFVFIVILAFGQANSISSTNQAIAALAGGFLPLVFRKFLFKPQAPPALDTNNLKWRALFDGAVETFENCWTFSDIIPSDRPFSKNMWSNMPTDNTEECENPTKGSKDEVVAQTEALLNTTQETNVSDDAGTEKLGQEMHMNDVNNPLTSDSNQTAKEEIKRPNIVQCQIIDDSDEPSFPETDAFQRLSAGDLDMVVQVRSVNQTSILKKERIKIFIRKDGGYGKVGVVSEHESIV